MKPTPPFELTPAGIKPLGGTVTPIDDAPRALLQAYIGWNDIEARISLSDEAMLRDHDRVATDDELRDVVKRWLCDDLCSNVDGDIYRPEFRHPQCPLHGKEADPERWMGMEASVAALHALITAARPSDAALPAPTPGAPEVWPTGPLTPEELAALAAIDNEPRAVLSFAQFQASGRDVPNLAAAMDDSGLPRGAGRVYEGPLWMQRKAHGRWYTKIVNKDVNGTLAEVERKLYDWGCGEVFDAPKGGR